MQVRKNAANLTDDEWARFMNAVVTLKHTFPGGSNVSVYDQFVAIHQAVTRLRWAGGGANLPDGGHAGPGFLPWHREYLKRFEQALQSVDAEVTIPFWNWGLGGDLETLPLFQDDRIGPMGSGPGLTVGSGYLAEAANAFNPIGWTIHPNLRQFGQAALSRGSVLDTSPGVGANPGWPTAVEVNGLIGATGFANFRPALEWPPHGIVHIRVGRDMSRMTSPNDPIFWLHHAQVDRIWALWQRTNPGTANYNPLATGGQGHRLDDWMWPWDGGAAETRIAALVGMIPRFPITDRVRPRDVINHRDLGYCYEGEDDCPCRKVIRPVPTRLFVETRPTAVRLEEPTTLRVGEEVSPTTLRIGEERPPTTAPLGEEILPTTLAVGEEDPTTFAVGEEGPLPTSPTTDDPLPIPVPRGPFGDF